ncbi:hypothetical protein MUN88_04455 [Gracilibacillus caseinilyticus]|uniref:Core domain-containing protein n=1 Tax=Gracilibacillus caseinilyticus TaxID=2932256 RepID=A0ABY4EY85_9BACI|nr:iron-sulfur cluster biosynthesis family protein [Gracilibacillus caseinilyticus]UOQ49375.1 hypothetical protein MUN88_04455 [Gracilibacillus caseinilyticus]
MRRPRYKRFCFTSKGSGDMIITISKKAQKQLRMLKIPDGQLPRIDATLTGGCGLSVIFSLFCDDQRKTDTVLKVNDISFRIDYATKRYLEEDIVYIDYYDQCGFIVGNDYVTNTCSLQQIYEKNEG